MQTAISEEMKRKIYCLKFDSFNPDLPSLNQARSYINSIDFTMIILKISRPDPNISRIWDEDCARQVVQYYKNYLWLLRKYSEEYPVLPPSVEIDEIWHHHILDTYKYHNDCLNIFGQYLHHYPYFGMRGEQDRIELNNTFKLTQQCYFQEFGEYIYSFETEESDHQNLL
ncbi:MAG: hypothetical protein K2X39_05830 [Silvanigrellaceae bacterium]|nr:hypothetical protein [Silvanigrellaceae bacterium]